jgi:predicted ATP-dependent endonuclease of OLD family
MEMNELNNLYTLHVRKTKELRLKLSENEQSSIDFIEKFIISSYLSHCASKILEILNGFVFYKYFNSSIINEFNIKNYDVYNRRVHSRMRSSIIDTTKLFGSYSNDRIYSKDDLINLFGNNIESILLNQIALNSLCEKINKHLKNLQINYKFVIESLTLKPKFDSSAFPNFDNSAPTSYNMLLLKDHKHVSFSDVGNGTRNLISIFAQLELAGENNKQSNLLIIREPENYLHPGLTGRVINYLFNSVASEKFSIIIETHSEIVIRQIQLIVKSKKNVSDFMLKDYLKIFYVDNNKDGSFIKELEIDSDGFLIEEIPDNFLGINAKLVTEMWK